MALSSSSSTLAVLSSFPSPPVHLPTSPLSSSAFPPTPAHSASTSSFASSGSLNPPPTLPPQAPLPPLPPTPSPISDMDAVLFMMQQQQPRRSARLAAGASSRADKRLSSSTTYSENSGLLAVKEREREWEKNSTTRAEKTTSLILQPPPRERLRGLKPSVSVSCLSAHDSQDSLEGAKKEKLQGDDEERPSSPDIAYIMAATPRARCFSAPQTRSSRSFRRGSAASSSASASSTSLGSLSHRRSSLFSSTLSSSLTSEDEQASQSMLDPSVAGEEDDDGAASDSSLDIHTPLPHLMLRAGLLSPRSKVLAPAEEQPVDVKGKADKLRKDARDTERRRTRHRDGRLLREGIGLTTGLGWSDSEDEDAPSPLTHRLSTLDLSRRPSLLSRSSTLSHRSSTISASTYGPPHPSVSARSSTVSLRGRSQSPGLSLSTNIPPLPLATLASQTRSPTISPTSSLPPLPPSFTSPPNPKAPLPLLTSSKLYGKDKDLPPPPPGAPGSGAPIVFNQPPLMRRTASSTPLRPASRARTLSSGRGSGIRPPVSVGTGMIYRNSGTGLVQNQGSRLSAPSSFNMPRRGSSVGLGTTAA